MPATLSLGGRHRRSSIFCQDRWAETSQLLRFFSSFFLTREIPVVFRYPWYRICWSHYSRHVPPSCGLPRPARVPLRVTPSGPRLRCWQYVSPSSSQYTQLTTIDIASISAIEGKNWRHGDIEDMLKTIAFIADHKWTSTMVKRVYFGNWLRD